MSIVLRINAQGLLVEKSASLKIGNIDIMSNNYVKGIMSYTGDIINRPYLTVVYVGFVDTNEKIQITNS